MNKIAITVILILAFTPVFGEMERLEEVEENIIAVTPIFDCEIWSDADTPYAEMRDYTSENIYEFVNKACLLTGYIIGTVMSGAPTGDVYFIYGDFTFCLMAEDIYYLIEIYAGVYDVGMTWYEYLSSYIIEIYT